VKTSPVLVLSLFAALATSASAAARPTLGVVAQDAVHKNWWYHRGAEAASEVFQRAPGKAAQFQVIDLGTFASQLREVRDGLNTTLPVATAKQIGRIAGTRYLLCYNITAFSRTASALEGTVDVRLIDTSTGEVVWADEVKHRLDPKLPGRSFTGSDEELGALIAWLTACVGTSLDKLNAAPFTP
jgi:curli biogenesis system outer membrane secretion channel CsgG